MPIVDQLFSWETLTAIIGGRSAIDVPRLQLADFGQAEGFLDCYGFRWNDAYHRDELASIRRQAVAFIVEELLSDEPGLAFPRELEAEADVRRVLLLASGPDDDPLQAWACALLRVMHTLAHCSSYFNDRFGPEIRNQILERIEAHLVRGADGLSLGHGEDAVPLDSFEVKHAKSTRSVLIKLLHKPENVATDVFDRLGVRFVTRERFDVLRVVRFLRVHNVVMFANVKPSRSRNSLVDLDALHDEMARLDAGPPRSPDEVLEHLSRFLAAQPLPPDRTHFNQYSALDYHAIQFTCRQLIRVPNPFSSHNGPRRRATDNATAHIVDSGPELRFFFPFEVQILDRGSFEVTRTGVASHDEYKSRQRETVKRRVLGRVLAR